MLWILPVAILVSAWVYLFSNKPKIHRNGEKLKQPADTLPLFGNAIRFLQPRHVLFDWFIQCQKVFGDETYEISVPSLPPGAVIISIENLEFILKNEAIITKGEFFKKRSWDLFGYGIINATGDLWRSQRKAGLKFFSGTNLEVMVDEVLPEVYEEKEAKLRHASDSNEQVDLQKVFLDLTTMVVGQMAYDMPIKADHPFSRAFDTASMLVSHRFQNPLYQITESIFPSPLLQAIKEVHAFGRHIVNQARKRRSHAAFESLITNDEVVFGSLIDSLLETFNDTKIVADAAMNFLSAGRDTTAQAMTWTMYALLRHPEVMQKARAEINEVLNPNSAQSPSITISTLQPTSLPYLTAILNESLRLYPPVPIEIKQCSSPNNTPITLPDGTTLPPNAVIVWCIWAMNRRQELWGSDAAEFKPERWLVLSSSTALDTNNDNNDSAPDRKFKFQARSAYEFPVFNGGPRACLGKKMAEVMILWVLVRVLSEWEFEEVLVNGKKEERVSQSSLTLPMLGGLPVHVKRRMTKEKTRDKKAYVEEEEREL